MTSVRTTKNDVVWNYIGTLVSMTSGLLLLPLLVHYLTGEELGLWYVYTAIANLAVLFEFGFDPTFARNIVYVISGAQSLDGDKVAEDVSRRSIDWHLLNTVISVSKGVYALIAMVVLVLLVTVGTAYIHVVAAKILDAGIMASWAIFCIAVFLNIYFLWSLTVLRGYGDIAGENKARTIGKMLQIIVSVVLLCKGFGLLGASLGYLMNSVAIRVSAVVGLRMHRDINEGRKRDRVRSSLEEKMEVLRSVGGIAWRDGVVSFSNYASTQAISVISSLFFGLTAAGLYSIALQFATAIVNLASAYPKAFFPAMQSAFAKHDNEAQINLVSSGIVVYWLLFIVGVFGVCVIVAPLLPFLKPGTTMDLPLFILLCIYIALWNQHGLFCNYIVSRNELPYMPGYLFAAVLGVVLSCVLCGVLHFGPYGIVLGQAVSQLLYNNWKWPMYLCEKLNTSYSAIIKRGVFELRKKIAPIISKGQQRPVRH